MSELALKVIAENKAAHARGEDATVLDLGNCGLTELPIAIEEVPWVEELILSNYWWIYDSIQQDYNQKFSKNAGDNNKLTSLSRVDKLPQLTKVNIAGCQAITNFEPLEKLKNLRALNCSDLQSSDLGFLQSIKNLELLDCSGNQISDLKPISKLVNLSALNCSDNHLNDLTPIANAQHLRRLDCCNTAVNNLRPLIPLINKDTPIIWGDRFRYQSIVVTNCPLICPPVEFAMEGHEAVVEYFDQLTEDDGPLNEIKVIVLGEGASGKTSLIKRVRGEDFDAKESQTHGIRIRKTDFSLEEDTVSAHIWDFGGQEVINPIKLRSISLISKLELLMLGLVV